MIYVLVNGNRMLYLQKRMNAKRWDETIGMKKDDTLILPIHWEIYVGEKEKEKWEDLNLFLPFHSNRIKKNNRIFYYMEDEKVLLENAKLTALGLMLRLCEYELSIYDLNIDIIGTGRCAMALKNLFELLNVKVCMVYHKQKESYILSTDYENKDKGNVIINTAPVCILLKEDKSLERVKYIIDLSSEKCLEEIRENSNINVIYPGSLPEVYFALSSATLIEEFIRSKLYEK